MRPKMRSAVITLLRLPAMAVEAGEGGRALRAALHLPDAGEDTKTSANVIDLEAAARSRKVS